MKIINNDFRLNSYNETQKIIISLRPKEIYYFNNINCENKIIVDSFVGNNVDITI